MLVGILLLATPVFCGKSIIPKNVTQFNYHQDDYIIVLERAVQTHVNYDYAIYSHGDFVPWNRTQRVFNYTFKAKRDYMITRLDVQGYKFMSNEYRFFPISVSVNACKEYQLNAFRAREILTQFSNLAPCAMKKFVPYYIKNALPDYTKFPPYIPRGQYKMSAVFFSNNDKLGGMDFYGQVKDKPQIW